MYYSQRRVMMMVMTTVVAKSAEDSERGFVGKEGRIVERKEN
jgi:hypothetical protein